jgi:hypothetical protein
MKRMPCAIPIMLTYSGMPAKYFSGMAIPSNTKNEMPSNRADIRRCFFKRTHKTKKHRLTGLFVSQITQKHRLTDYLYH